MWSKFTFELNRKEVLGKGQHSVVYGGAFRSNAVAIKRIELARFNRNLDMDVEQRNLLSLDHPNIVKMLSVQDGSDFKFFVMEKCAASLDDYYKNVYSGLVPSALKGLLDMAQGLKFIHSEMKLVHRNLKPGNVLISLPDDRGTVTLKLSDLCFNKFTSRSISFCTIELGGCKKFLPIEILETYEQPIDDRKPNVTEALQRSDIFTLGCIFFTYLTKGKHPFRLNSSILPNIIEKKADLTGMCWSIRQLKLSLIDFISSYRSR